MKFYNENTQKVLSEKEYNEMIEREIVQSWKDNVLDEHDKFESFDEYRTYMLNEPDSDFALVEQCQRCGKLVEDFYTEGISNEKGYLCQKCYEETKD